MKREKEYTEKGESMGRALRVIEAAIAVVVFALIGLLLFRLWLHSYYPREVSRVLPTDDLRAAYAAGELHLKTQALRVEYDDPNEGLFFADHLTFDEGTGSVQIAVRYNKSTLTKLAARHGEAFDPEAEEPFVYRIFCCTGEGEDGALAGRTYAVAEHRDDSLAMYRYRRLAFEDVDLTGVIWIRLEILLAGQDTPQSYISIYENHGDYNTFEDYELKESELS